MAGKEGLRTLNGPVAVEKPRGRNGLRGVSVLPDQISHSDNNGEARVPALAEALKHNVAAVRWSAANALGRLGDPSAVPALTEALSDNDEHVRWSAANALWAIGDPSAVPAWVGALEGGDERVKKIAIDALEKAGVAAVPALLNLLNGGEWKAKSCAAKVLGRIRDASAVPALIGKLGDEGVCGAVRSSIAEALADIAETHPDAPGLAETFPAVKRALDSEGR